MGEKTIMEGSTAVAHVAARCKPDVIAAYPITPSTHIPQELSRIQPDYGFEFVPVEAEFSALSALIGASAAGSRTFTATSSQGLLLMHEALFNASGMRLPIVMVVANRSVSAPLSIWNDWQDSVSQRDAGWIQLYCKNNQETLDTLVQAFAIAEQSSNPAMVCFDGFYLTHEVSPLELPSQKEVNAFLPAFNPKHKLDSKNPLSFGCYANPSYYQEFKRSQDEALRAALPVIEKVAKRFEKKFKRKQTALVEEYEKGDTVFLTMGSLAENCEEAVDSMRGVGLVRLKCFRPFPAEALARALKGKKKIVVLEKDVGFGFGGALACEVKALLQERGNSAEVASVVCGLGGKDVSVEQIKRLKDAKGFKWL